MQPFGKTYLIECKKDTGITKYNGIYIVNDSLTFNDIFWKGTVIGYGTGWSEEDRKDLVPLNSEIIMSYGKDTKDKGGTKIVFNDRICYIRDAEEILGVIGND